jgi:hypothetical protein
MIVLNGFMKNFSEERSLTGMNDSALFQAFAVSSSLGDQLRV